jgi:hypothetical protein
MGSRELLYNYSVRDSEFVWRCLLTTSRLAGDYTVIVSAFEPHYSGSFSVKVESSHPFDLKSIPQEGAGMYNKTIRGSWYVLVSLPIVTTKLVKEETGMHILQWVARHSNDIHRTPSSKSIYHL